MRLGFRFPTTHIYIFVKDRFNATQFLSHPLLEINCLGVLSATTNSTHARSPGKVEWWAEFLNNAKEYTLDEMATFSAPLSRTKAAVNEAGVGTAFSANVISKIETYFDTVLPQNKLQFLEQVPVDGGGRCCDSTGYY